MKIITYIQLCFISLLLLSLESLANTTPDDNYTIYLVRHAEKIAGGKDPALTSCGMKRATQLATILKQAKIKQIYSTQTLRTQQTAAPLATQLNLQVTAYSAKDLASFAQQVKNTKTNTLIVGHSNTTPQLTALIANTPVADITEAEYQMLYQVQFHGENTQLTLLKQPLSCQ
ncbi:SixA phosphatase family protein [Thalassotalea piscium]